MAHTGIYATSGETIFKAGVGHADISEGDMNDLHKQAEARLHAIMRRDTSGAYATMSESRRRILSEWVSNETGIYMIQNDMSGINTRTEAENRINILHTRNKEIESIIKDKKFNEDFL